MDCGDGGGAAAPPGATAGAVHVSPPAAWAEVTAGPKGSAALRCAFCQASWKLFLNRE